MAVQSRIDIIRRYPYSSSIFDVKIWRSYMRVVSSLKSIKKRDRDNVIVRRRGKVYVINKRRPRMKAKQRWKISFYY